MVVALEAQRHWFGRGKGFETLNSIRGQVYRVKRVYNASRLALGAWYGRKRE
jgi:hypothetical protein